MKNIENQEDILTSKEIVDIFTLASEFCMFIDRMDKCEPAEAFVFLQKILPALYLKGALCPVVEAEDLSANERFVTEEEYETQRYQLSQYFADRDMFTTVDLFSDNINSVPISLSELLCDIYTDLKDFLILFSKDSRAAKENAVANCASYFKTGWGMRLVMALPYVHLLCEGTPAEEEMYGEL